MFLQKFLVFTMQRIYPFKNPTWATKGLHSPQLHPSPFQKCKFMKKIKKNNKNRNKK